MNKPTINFASLQKNHWNEQDRLNAKSVIDLVQQLMNNHDFASVEEKYKNITYTQHNRSMANGIGGVLDSLSSLVKAAPEFSYDVKHIFVDGDFVTIHSHATLKAAHRGNERKGLNIIDTWKVDNGVPVEHWDAVQPLSLSMRLFNLFTGGAVRNHQGVF